MKNDVGYLIKRIHDKLAVRADAELKQYHLTMSQGRVFLYLSSRGGQATQKEIETFLGVAHPKCFYPPFLPRSASSCESF